MKTPTKTAAQHPWRKFGGGSKAPLNGRAPNGAQYQKPTRRAPRSR